MHEEIAAAINQQTAEIAAALQQRADELAAKEAAKAAALRQRAEELAAKEAAKAARLAVKAAQARAKADRTQQRWAACTRCEKWRKLGAETPTPADHEEWHCALARADCTCATPEDEE